MFWTIMNVLVQVRVHLTYRTPAADAREIRSGRSEISDATNGPSCIHRADDPELAVDISK